MGPCSQQSTYFVLVFPFNSFTKKNVSFSTPLFMSLAPSFEFFASFFSWKMMATWNVGIFQKKKKVSRKHVYCCHFSRLFLFRYKRRQFLLFIECICDAERTNDKKYDRHSITRSIRFVLFLSFEILMRTYQKNLVALWMLWIMNFIINTISSHHQLSIWYLFRCLDKTQTQMIKKIDRQIAWI